MNNIIHVVLVKDSPEFTKKRPLDIKINYTNFRLYSEISYIGGAYFQVDAL